MISSFEFLLNFNLYLTNRLITRFRLLNNRQDMVVYQPKPQESYDKAANTTCNFAIFKAK
jgi:hypothetical protein